MKRYIIIFIVFFLVLVLPFEYTLLSAARISSRPYTVILEQNNVPEHQTHPAIQADFDNDGFEDIISPTKFFYFYSFTITSGRTGQTLLSVGSGNGGFNGYSIVSFNADGSYPSIVFAVYRYDAGVPSGFASIAQKIAINNEGVFSIQDLPVSLIGRDVACTRNFFAYYNPVCFFASYYDYEIGAGTSKLIEIHPDGTITDITAAVGLPFPASNPNGRFMIGAAWSDFSGDGMPDLVAVGQHSQILTAVSNPNGTMRFSWIGTEDDYMRVFYYVGTDLLFSEQPPCVYIATEQGQANQSDFLICFDKKNNAWYNPASNSARFVEWSFERPVRFWKQPDGKIVFAANNGGILNLFSISQ